MRQALWMQIFVFLQPMWHKEKEDVFLILEHSSLRNGGRGGEKKKKKRTRKNMKFWPLNHYCKRPNWKTRLSERFSYTLTSKLWNNNKKKNKLLKLVAKWSEIELYSPPYGFIKNLRQNHPRDSHLKLWRKNKVGNTTWAKLRSLIGQK